MNTMTRSTTVPLATARFRSGRTLPASASACPHGLLLFIILMGMRRLGCPLIDAALGQPRQLLVSRLFFLERLLQKFGGLSVSHRLRPGDQVP